MDTDMTKEERIEQLLLIIASCEVTLRQFPDDARIRSQMNKTKLATTEKLRKVIYGIEDPLA